MSKKNVYFYELIIKECQTGKKIRVDQFKALLDDTIKQNSINNSIELTYEQIEPVLMDIIENTEEYLFVRLSRKRLNNSIQKRNYKTRVITDVLAPDELGENGIELFTYCILGYTHGVLSIAKSKGAPGPEAFTMLFAVHNRKYSAETLGIPNNDLVQELLNGKSPQVIRVCFDVACPSAQLLQQAFGFDDKNVISAIKRKTASMVMEIKPDFRGSLIDDKKIIKKLIESLRKNQNRYNTIKITGKKDGRGPSREYDLYEEYFKYPVEIKEYRQEGGRKIEVSKKEIQLDYRAKMMNVYEHYKTTILTFVNREY